MMKNGLLEYDKCKGDFIYFINKYTYFYKYSPLLADFKLYDFQEEVLKAVDESDSIVINSARQMGITTILMGYALWKCNFTPGYKVRLMDVSMISGIRHLEVFRKSYENLPDHIKTPFELDGKKKIKLCNGSSITVVSQSPESVQHFPTDMLIVDNAAFTQNVQNPFSTNSCFKGKLIAVSTLYKQGWFAEMCELSEKNQSGFTYIKLPYWKHPKRSRLWRSNLNNSIGPDSAVVEYDCTHYYDREMKLVPLIKD